MSSPQSLFGLVSHLQHMEQKLTDILLEAAMKMSSLTDSSIFILVETQEGRKFSGKPHLCDAYRQSRLIPTEADVECLVDLNSRTVNYSSPKNASSGFSSAPASLPKIIGASCRKRNHDQSDEDVVIEPVPKVTRTPEREMAAPASTTTTTMATTMSVVPLKQERNDGVENEIIFLRDTIDGNVENSFEDGRRETSCGPPLDLPLPPSAGLEHSFESLFTQNEIPDVNESMNFGSALIPCENDVSAVSSKVRS